MWALKGERRQASRQGEDWRKMTESERYVVVIGKGDDGDKGCVGRCEGGWEIADRRGERTME